jgi:hypothetical protein
MHELLYARGLVFHPSRRGSCTDSQDKALPSMANSHHSWVKNGFHADFLLRQWVDKKNGSGYNEVNGAGMTYVQCMNCFTPEEGSSLDDAIACDGGQCPPYY